MNTTNYSKVSSINCSDDSEKTIIKPQISLSKFINNSHSENKPFSRERKRKDPEESFSEKDLSQIDFDHENFQIEYNIGEWTFAEHELFLKAMAQYGNKWNKVQEIVKTRSKIQIRSHAQKYFAANKIKALKKIKREGKDKELIFLVTREYRNLNHIIQKNPIEILIDPIPTRKPKNYETKVTQGDTIYHIIEENEILQNKSMEPKISMADGKLDDKLNDTLLYNFGTQKNSLDVEITENKDENEEILLDINEVNNLDDPLSFCGKNDENNYEEKLRELPEVNGFLSKIAYEYS